MHLSRILIVDDDPDIGNLLQEALARSGYETQRAYSGTEALLLLKEPRSRPDLVLLDLMLPGVNGETVLEECSSLPVIVISARVGVEDKVSLLHNGARDYVTKPFSVEELLARIEVQLRMGAGAPDTLTYGPLHYDRSTRAVTAGDTLLRLTPTENALLRLLMEHPHQVLTKSALLDALMAEDLDGTESSLKVHISNLRRKLQAGCGEQLIESVWGIGFRLCGHP